MSDTTPDALRPWMPAPPRGAPKKPRGSIVTLLVWMLAGGIVAFAFERAGMQVRAGHVLMLLLGGVLAAWLQLLVHEAGHALAGLSRGMHLFALGLGPLRIEQTRDGWHARWSRNVAGLGGFAALSPAAGREPRRIDQAIFIVGGPLANLLVAACVLPFAQSSTAPAGAGLMWGLVGFGVLYGVVNLLPFRSGGWRTDGLSLIQLWRKPDEARAAQQVQMIVGLALGGVRPRDWSPSLIPACDPGFDPMLGRSLVLLRLSWALDADRCDEAETLATMIAADHAVAPDGIRQSQALMMANFAARCVRSESLLSAWLPLSEGGLLDMEAQREWLRAELAALRDATSDAREHIARARSALPRVHDAGTQIQLADYLDALEARLAGISAAA
jgi:hypothetical protein